MEFLPPQWTPVLSLCFLLNAIRAWASESKGLRGPTLYVLEPVHFQLTLIRVKLYLIFVELFYFGYCAHLSLTPQGTTAGEDHRSALSV